ERRQPRAVSAHVRVVRSAKAPAQAAGAVALGDQQPLVGGVERLRVAELQPVERLEPHRCSSRSTYFASTSTSRLTSSPGPSSPSVVTSSVCGTSATAKPASASAATVSDTPSTVIEPFSTV